MRWRLTPGAIVEGMTTTHDDQLATVAGTGDVSAGTLLPGGPDTVKP